MCVCVCVSFVFACVWASIVAPLFSHCCYTDVTMLSGFSSPGAAHQRERVEHRYSQEDVDQPYTLEPVHEPFGLEEVNYVTLIVCSHFQDSFSTR
jgi:hypothetical protein